MPRLLSPAFCFLVGSLAACGDELADGNLANGGPDPAQMRPLPTLAVESVEAERSLSGLTPSRDAFLIVRAAVSLAANGGRSVPVTTPQFSLGLASNVSLLAASAVPDGACAGDLVLDPGGSLTCSVAFDVERDAALAELRFVDPTLGTDTPIVAELPVRQVPLPELMPEAELGDLSMSEMTELCSEGGGPTGGTTENCTIPMVPFPVPVTIVPDTVQACEDLQLPFRFEIPALNQCLEFETGECTVEEYRACRATLADDLCELAQGVEACMCVRPTQGSCD